MPNLQLRIIVIAILLYSGQLSNASATANSFYNTARRNRNTSNVQTDRQNVNPSLQLNFQLGHQQQLGTTAGLGMLFPLMNFQHISSSLTLLGDLHVAHTPFSELYNAGIGGRYYNHRFIVGLFGYFDVADVDLQDTKYPQLKLDPTQLETPAITTDRYLRQATISAEILYPDWELHANYYVPLSDSVDLTTSAAHSNHSLLTLSKQLPAQLLYTGYEIEIGANIAKQRQQDAYIYLAYYDFQTTLQDVSAMIDPQYDHMTGFVLRSRSMLWQTATSQLMIDAQYDFKDRKFGDEEYYIGLNYQVNFGRRLKRTQTGLAAKIMDRTARRYAIQQVVMLP